MASVWLSRFSRWLEALLNVKGGPVLTDVDPNLRAVALLMEGTEDRYLQAWNRFAFSFGVVAGGAQNAAAQIRNPPGSNVIAVVERIQCVEALTNSSIRIDVGYLSSGIIADLATIMTAANVARLDGRINTGSSCIASASTNAGAQLTPRILTQWSGPGVQILTNPNQEIPLTPGSAVQLFEQTTGATVIFDIMWRERALQSSELT